LIGILWETLKVKKVNINNRQFWFGF